MSSNPHTATPAPQPQAAPNQAPPRRELRIDNDPFAKMYLGQASLGITFWVWGLVVPLAWMAVVCVVTAASPLGPDLMAFDEFWVQMNWWLLPYAGVWTVAIWRSSENSPGGLNGWGVAARIIAIVDIVILVLEVLAGQTVGS